MVFRVEGFPFRVSEFACDLEILFLFSCAALWVHGFRDDPRSYPKPKP